MANVRIGDVLIEESMITPKQLEEAMAYQKEHRSKRLGEILLEKDFITQKQLIKVLGRTLNIALYDKSIPFELDCIKLIPKALCIKYNVVATNKTSDGIIVAVFDPLDLYAIEDIKSIVKKPIEIQIAEKSEIESIINKAYTEIEMTSAATSANQNLSKTVTFAKEIATNENDAPVVNLINSLLLKGEQDQVSDVHIEPFENKTVIRMRIDGQLIHYLDLSPALHQSLVARIKILSDLDIAERRIPQDGHFRVKINGVDLNIRVSTIPTVFNEKIVLRFLSKNNNLDYAATFGMHKENFEKFKRILSRPHGIIYITGPTGSGKTTTLYMVLDSLSRKAVNISTIEDPVEKNLERINQTQVNLPAGLTFGAGLRSLLRQDPDIIMVGETRDNETAEIAVSAALTGHLVLSTLHTNDSISTIVRLNDMEVEPYMIASSLVGVVAQRLVKKICPNCLEEYTPEDDEREIFKGVNRLARGTGCHMCNYTGYKGRIAIHEILEIDSVISNMIASKTPLDAVYRYVRDGKKIIFLQDDVFELVVKRITTVEEYKKIVTIF